MRLVAAMVGMGAMVLGAQAQPAAERQVAARPPMGWNSWDAYGLTITEEQFRAYVMVLSTQLKDR
jgi:alpha-galactosidase